MCLQFVSRPPEAFCDRVSGASEDLGGLLLGQFLPDQQLEYLSVVAIKTRDSPQHFCSAHLIRRGRRWIWFLKGELPAQGLAPVFGAPAVPKDVLGYPNQPGQCGLGNLLEATPTDEEGLFDDFLGICSIGPAAHGKA